MKRILASVIVLSLPVALCSTAFASSKNSEPHVLTIDQFTELLSTGNVTQPAMRFTKNKSIDICHTKLMDINSDNQLVWIRTDSLTFAECTGVTEMEGFQPASIIDGMLFMVNYFRQLDPRTKKITVIKGVVDLPEFTLLQLSYFSLLYRKVIDYPKLPIVFRTSEDESFSLLHLTYIFDSVSAELIAQGKDLKREEFRTITKEWIQIPRIIQENFPKLIKIVNNEPKWNFDSDIRAFTLDKEKLFFTIKRLHEASGDFSYQDFFKEILKIDQKLTRAYNDATLHSKKNAKDANQQRTAEIMTILSQREDIERRDNMAKALLLDTFCYVEEPLFDVITNVKLMNKDIRAILYTKYGQMARLIEHTKPHFQSEDDKIPLVPEKSLFILKSDTKMEDFYEVLCNAIIDDATPNNETNQMNRMYKINDVTVANQAGHEDNGTIKITIALTDALVANRLQNMLSTNGMGNISSTNQVMCVLHEDCGSFELKTLYPTNTQQSISSKKEDKEAIYKLYDETFLPARLQAKNRKEGNILHIYE